MPLERLAVSGATPNPGVRRLLHGSCVALQGVGVLITGASGAGKSDLALRLIDGGGALVSDDQTWIDRTDGRLDARPPATLAGLLEVHGLGIFRLPHEPSVALHLVVHLVRGAFDERLPEVATETLLGVAVPLIRVDPWRASAPAMVRLAAAAERVH